MIQIPPKGETHWAESAQALVGGLLLLAASLKGERRTLGVTRDFLAGSDHALKQWAEKNLVKPDQALYKYMDSVKTKAFGHIARTGSMFMDIADKELGSIVSTARTQTAFLDSPELRRALSSSSFDLGDLRVGYKGTGQPMTIYLCLPASRMASHGRWLRIMINLALQAFERAPKVKPEPPPTLFILEELCTTIGYSKQLEQAAGLMAGYGIKLWSVIQDLSQLKAAYENGWETFVGNAGTLTFFGNSDVTTLEYISEKLGQRSFKVPLATNPTPGAVLQGARSESDQLRMEALLSPTEAEHLLAREKMRVLVVPAGKKPFIVRAADYLEEERPGVENPFKGKYDRHET
jgi:type IV secretion system protein VirD4